MALLGDIRYSLTQSHYKRTNPYVCACVWRHVQYSMCVWSFERNKFGWYVCLCVRQYVLHIWVFVCFGRRLFSLLIRLLIEDFIVVLSGLVNRLIFWFIKCEKTVKNLQVIKPVGDILELLGLGAHNSKPKKFKFKFKFYRLPSTMKRIWMCNLFSNE